MNSDIKKRIEKGDVEMLLVNKELAERIKKLSKAMDTVPADILDAAINIVEKGLGREIIVREDKWDLKIEAFKSKKKQYPLTD